MEEERRRETERAQREQTWITTEFGLETDEPTQTPQCGIGPTQCRVCITHRIPILHFCYRCFPDMAVNQIITTTTRRGTTQYKCRMCFKEMPSRSDIRLHCAEEHVPRNYIDFRYLFRASGYEDNDEMDPRSLPLRPGILILWEPQPIDADTPSGLDQYIPPTPGTSRSHQLPLPLAPRHYGKRLRTDPSLDYQLCLELCQEEGCFMLCGNAAMVAILGIAMTTATWFQMQGAINLNCSLPFLTPAEEGDLGQAYNISANRGYLTPQHYAALADKMRVPVTTV